MTPFRKFVLSVMCLVMVASVVLKIGLLFYLISHSPSSPEPVSGKICPLNNHGRLFYITRLQSVLQDVLMYVFGTLMFFFVVLKIYWEISAPPKKPGSVTVVH